MGFHADNKTRVAVLSVASNSLLVLLKIITGLLMGSVSVLSEAIHSAVDLVASVIALVAVRVSAKPADEGHPFGHGKVENISGAVEALLIFLAGGWIIYESVGKLQHPAPLEAVGWGVGVMCLSSLANLMVSGMLFKVGRQTGSVALMADGWHLRTDVYTSAGVMAGLGIVWAGRSLWPAVNLRWIDPVAAIAVALLILKTAYQLTLEASRDLFDASLSRDELALISAQISSAGPHVRGFHQLLTRKAGSERFVQFHLLVNSLLSLDEAHRLSGAVKARIKEHLPATNVIIHVEPCAGDCKPDCIPNCNLAEAERKALGAGKVARGGGALR